MIIDKAIKRNKKLREERGLLPYIDAIQLGIEGLKLLKAVRAIARLGYPDYEKVIVAHIQALLPSETEE